MSFGSTLYDRRIILDVVTSVVVTFDLGVDVFMVIYVLICVPVDASIDNNIVVGVISMCPCANNIIRILASANRFVINCSP